jgi:hypothetical protein
MRDKKWQKFEDLIAEELKELDPYIKHTKGSIYGDLKTSLALHIECKDYNKKNVYNEDHMQKCIEEVPLHSKKLPILITRNKDKKIRVHLDFYDFLNLYKKYYKLKNKINYE